MRPVKLKLAAEHTGLSEWELRTGAISGKYPHMRIGGPRGKIVFDLELLDTAISRLMLSNTPPEQSAVNCQGGKIRRII